MDKEIRGILDGCYRLQHEQNHHKASIEALFKRVKRLETEITGLRKALFPLKPLKGE